MAGKRCRASADKEQIVPVQEVIHLLPIAVSLRITIRNWEWDYEGRETGLSNTATHSESDPNPTKPALPRCQLNANIASLKAPYQLRIRAIYLTTTIVVILLGLSSRKFGDALPAFIATYAGDTLWALMVFLGISMLLPAMPSPRRGIIALTFSYLIELGQLYHAPWIDSLRETTLGGLILGFGFLASDLLCYTFGVGLGVATDLALRQRSSAPEEACQS